MIFVFGSNESGIHGAGAAKFAITKRGAELGESYGHRGQSFAIPTKDRFVEKTLSLDIINDYVRGFISYAKSRPNLQFQITCIGCGLAGLNHEDVSIMFKDSPANCYFDELWKPYLGESKQYWGTF